MEEVWVALKEFQLYAVSDQGVIINIATRRPVRYSYTRQGGVKVGLRQGGMQHTRSVKVLVAQTFVRGKTFIYNTPINLDGDPTNNTADNLAWRPRWFAWKYTRQFVEDMSEYKTRRVRDVESGEIYKNIVEASIENGLLFEHVMDGIFRYVPVFPTNQMFVFV